MTRLNQKIFKEALKNSGGNQSIIAKKIGVTRGAVNQYLKRFPKMRDLLELEAERIIDVAENIIDGSITNDKDIDSAKWKLLNSKKGKARGYGAKTEIEHSGEGVKIDVNIPEDVKELFNKKD